MIAQLEAVADMAPAHGLPYEAARLAQIASLTTRLADADPAAAKPIRYELDAQASALFRRLALDFAAGRIDPAAADPNWHFRPQPPDTDELEAAALAGGAVAATLWDLLPRHAEYLALLDAFAIVSGQPDAPGDEGEIARADRLDKLRATLERWRWMPRTLPERRLEVHVPEFHVAIMRGETVERTYRAIVGRGVSPTPSFEGSISGVIVNPRWVPPASILYGELVPKFRRDPASVSRSGYTVYSASGAKLDPAKVDWSARPLRVQVVQNPGAGNALGRMKLDMPNPFAVYLHDTPGQDLFAQSDRTFSHGCIRVENIRALAVDLLEADNWPPAEIDALVEGGTTTLIPLATPLPVYIIYVTANRQDNGPIAYAADIYGRDAELLAALKREDALSAGTR